MAKRFEKAKAYTLKYKDVLLPCRCCGSADIHITSERSILCNPRDEWAVSCTTTGCDCTASFTSVKKAIEIWNEKNDLARLINTPQFSKYSFEDLIAEAESVEEYGVHIHLDLECFCSASLRKLAELAREKELLKVEAAV